MISVILDNLMQWLSLRGVLIEAAVDGGTLVEPVEGEPVTAAGLPSLRVNSEVEVESHVSSEGRLTILDHVHT